MEKKLRNNFLKFQSTHGQSLVELLVAIGLSSILFPALLTGLYASNKSKAQVDQRTQAVTLLKEADEAVRSIRDNGWATFAINGTYHPTITGTIWSLASNSETINGLIRSIAVSDVQRNAQGGIVSSGGTIDPSMKQVITTVSWILPYPSSIQTIMYLSRYRNNIAYTQTSQSVFNAGIVDPLQIQVTNTSGGEVTLANNNKAKWCSPAFSTASIDLPDGPPVAVAATANATDTSIPNDIFVATAPNDSSAIKLAYVNVTANTTTPNPSLRGTFTLDSTKYSNASYLPTGINVTNNFKTNDVKYYKSSSGKLYALLATNIPNHEVIAVKVKDGMSDTYQDPINKIYTYQTFFNTKMYDPPPFIVVNGSFETGIISPYTTIINSGTGVINNTTVHGGSYSGRVSTSKTSLSGVSGGGGCAGGNRIAVTPSTTYTWSSWLNIPASGNTKFKDARVRIAWYSACSGGSVIATNDSTLVSTTNQGWGQVTGTANSGTATFAEIQLLLRSTTSGTTSTVYFDDLGMNVTATTFNDQAPFDYGATALTILGNTGYIDSGGYLYAFDLSTIDSKSPTNELDQVGCRILLDGYDCKPGTGIDQKYVAGETGATWGDTISPAHNDCTDGGNVELNADNQLSAVQVGSNKYVYVAVGAGTNPELDIVDASTPPTNNLTNNTCGRGSDTGWKVTSNLDFDPANGTEEAANSVYAKSDGTRAYMSSNGGIIHNGISDSAQFYIINTTNKSSPQFLSTWPSTVAGQHYANTPQTGYYNATTNADLQLYPRRALTVLNGQRAILVGQDGIANDGIEPHEYQVLHLETESTPTYCGGLNFLSGFNDLTSVSEADGDNFVYMVANTNEKQLKIIEGGPDSGIFVSSGTFTSSVYDLESQSAVNRFTANVNQPVNTTIKMQLAVASVGNDGTCNTATYSYVGTDGTQNTYFTVNGSTISGIIPTSTSGAYQNPGRCLRYQVILSSTDQLHTPTLYDVLFNYSP